jgi:hypothetical protein
MGYYAVSSGNFLPTFWNNLSVPSLGLKNPKEGLCEFLNPEDGAERLTRNIGKKLQVLAL